MHNDLSIRRSLLLCTMISSSLNVCYNSHTRECNLPQVLLAQLASSSCFIFGGRIFDCDLHFDWYFQCRDSWNLNSWYPSFFLFTVSGFISLLWWMEVIFDLIDNGIAYILIWSSLKQWWSLTFCISFFVTSGDYLLWSCLLDLIALFILTGVGKSCILLRFSDGSFTTSFITTIGYIPLLLSSRIVKMGVLSMAGPSLS